MCSILDQVKSFMNYVVFDEGEDDDDNEDRGLSVKIIIDFTNLIDEVPEVYHQD
jgi:hypothetical protein